MELDRIDILIEKYFQGETIIAEEKELQHYFSSSDVAQHLEQYRPMFGYFAKAKEQEFTYKIPVQSKRNRTWLSVAASIVILFGVGTYVYFNNDNQSGDLGTYDNPETAFRETQKALAMLSNNVNAGIESVKYVKEYQDSKNLIFKQ
jgi:hypothetical protein